MRNWRESIKSASKVVNLLSGLLYYPYCAMDACGLTRQIPVLMYHKIVRSFIPGHAINYTVTAASFENQMQWLATYRYKPISIDDYIACLYRGEPWPRRAVLITFDDGYRGVYQIAHPILKRYGFPAVLFASCSFLGREEFFPYDKHLEAVYSATHPELLPLSWAETKEIQDIVSVGSHTMSHVLLAPLPDEQIAYEVAESKRVLEDRLGRNVVSFSYPGGLRQHRSFDSRTRQALLECGYKVAFNSEIGRNGLRSDPYQQRRIVAEDGDSQRLLKSKLAGAYDWARLPQYVFHLMYDSPANRQQSVIQRF